MVNEHRQEQSVAQDLALALKGLQLLVANAESAGIVADRGALRLMVKELAGAAAKRAAECGFTKLPECILALEWTSGHVGLLELSARVNGILGALKD